MRTDLTWLPDQLVLPIVLAKGTLAALAVVAAVRRLDRGSSFHEEPGWRRTLYAIMAASLLIAAGSIEQVNAGARFVLRVEHLYSLATTGFLLAAAALAPAPAVLSQQPTPDRRLAVSSRRKTTKELTSKSRPVLVMNSILAALAFLFAGAAVTDVYPAKYLPFTMLVLGAVQLGWGKFVDGAVTPWEDVVAKATQDGDVVAGPAANSAPGTPLMVARQDDMTVVAPDTVQAPDGEELVEPTTLAPVTVDAEAEEAERRRLLAEARSERSRKAAETRRRRKAEREAAERKPAAKKATGSSKAKKAAPGRTARR